MKNKSKTPVIKKIKVMFDFCSDCLWDANGVHLDIQRLEGKVPLDFIIRFGRWIQAVDAVAWPDECAEEPSKSGVSGEEKNLDQWGFRLAQELAFYLKNEKTKVSYFFLHSSLEKNILCPRPMANSYVCFTGTYWNNADKELAAAMEEAFGKIS